jgi:hypothetical protein
MTHANFLLFPKTLGRILMDKTDADQCRAVGIWPVRPMTPFEPPPPPRPPRPSRARCALEIAWRLIAPLVLPPARVFLSLNFRCGIMIPHS